MRYVIAIAAGLLIWWLATSIIRMLATDPGEPDPADVVPSSQEFRCAVCGTEVTMTVQSVTETNAPRHCREPMNPVWRPG